MFIMCYFEQFSSFFFFLMIRRPPRSTLFPYNDALPILSNLVGSCSWNGTKTLKICLDQRKGNEPQKGTMRITKRHKKVRKDFSLCAFSVPLCAFCGPLPVSLCKLPKSTSSLPVQSPHATIEV